MRTPRIHPGRTRDQRLPRVGIAATLIGGVIAEGWIFSVPADHEQIILTTMTLGARDAITADDTNFASIILRFYAPSAPGVAGSLITTVTITTQATIGSYHTGSIGGKSNVSWALSSRVVVPPGGSCWYEMTKSGGGKVTPGFNLTLS